MGQLGSRDIKDAVCAFNALCEGLAARELGAKCQRAVGAYLA